MKLSIFSLFRIVRRAKAIDSYQIANLGFAALLDAALDREKEFRLHWAKNFWNDDDDIYFDLFIISDGLRDACIPASLLKHPRVLRSLCMREEISRDTYLGEADYENEDWPESTSERKKELYSLKEQILIIAPNAQFLANKYLAEKECQICPYFVQGHNKGALYCTVHPFGYPEELCRDWEII